jgi:hypothetical protein
VKYFKTEKDMNIKKTGSLLIGLFLAGSGLFSQVPFEYVLVDESGPVSPWGKATGDINRDGYPDLIVGGWRGSVDRLVWYQYPNWNKNVISQDRIGTDIEMADMNNDSIPDVVVVAIEGLQWYQAPGWEKHLLTPQVRLHDVEVADLNGDGWPDVAARDQKYASLKGDTIHLYISSDSTNIWEYYTIACSKGEGLIIYDVNLDNKPDLVIGEVWFENSGEMDRWPAHQYTSLWDYPHTYIAAGDMDGDGLTDFVLAPTEEAGDVYKIAWYKNPGNTEEEWSEQVIVDEIETTCHFVGTADFNNDGKIDVAVAQMEQSTDPDEVFILLNQDKGKTWIKQVLATTGSHSMKITDIDSDGDFDIFGANWDNNSKVELWRNLSDTIGNHSSALDDWQRHVVDASKEWASVFIDGKDLNGDSLPEIITGGWWYTNPGTAGGTWSKNNIGELLKNMACVYDFDDDGDYDILGTTGEGDSSSAKFVWARNDGDANFTVLQNIEQADGDFLQGIAVVRKEMETPYEIALSWHVAGKGVQTLTVPADPSEEKWTWKKISDISQDECLSSGDIDRDGTPDLLLGTRWLQNNQGVWNLNTLSLLEDAPDRNKLTDIDNDGIPDAVIGYEAISDLGKLAWYKQSDSVKGEWQENMVAHMIGPMSLDAVDMDDDGDIDIVAGEHNLAQPDSANMFVFENLTGNGRKWARHTVHTGDEHHDGAVTVDIDNDGDLDILSIGWGHNNVLLYENKAKAAIPSHTKIQNKSFNSLKVYPNPAREKIMIELKTKTGESVYTQIYNSSGVLVYNSVEKNNGPVYHSTIQTRNWMPGLYIIKVQAGVNFFLNKTLILK